MVGEQTTNGIEQNDYQTALKNYWAGRRQTSLEFLTTTLTSNPNHSDMFAMYRLWIEILSTEHRSKSLSMLLEHMQMRGILSPDQSDTFAALRALAHLELDEHQAVRLYERSLAESKDNPYAAEFFVAVKNRKAEQADEETLETLASSDDYFHLNRVFITYKLSKQSQPTRSAITLMQQRFPGTPKPYEYNLQTSWDTKDWNSAKKQARSLANLYPGNIENYIILGLCALKLHHTEEALDALEKALNMGGAHDPDVLSLLGQTYQRLKSSSENQEEVHQFALKCLTSAQRTLQRMGHDTTVLDCHISKVSTYEESYTENPKIFLVRLDQKSYYEFKHAHVDEIDQINIPLAKPLTPGDFCFLSATMIGASKNKQQKPLRIAGLYEVCGESAVNQDGIYHTPCQLVHKPSHSLSIEIAIQNEDRRSRSAFTCFELNDQAIDRITEEIQFRTEASAEEATAWGAFAPMAKVS